MPSDHSHPARPAKARRRLPSPLREFLDGQASGGLVLMGAAALALAVANSPLAPAYFAALHASLGPLSVLHWINDGLMAVFFLLVGLEIKREVVDGQLARWSRRVLPGAAALGGMVAPALVFLAFNADDPATARGWAIPSATDIAFALGVLSLLGERVPASLKVFLAALAIIDDLGAVLVIALFYSGDLSLFHLGLAALVLAALLVLNRAGVARLAPFLLLGAALWFLVLRSGVHATVAGVALALTIPLRAFHSRMAHPASVTMRLKQEAGGPSRSNRDGSASKRPPERTGGPERSPLHRLEHLLHPWVTFGIIPLFGFANAGVPLSGLSLAVLSDPLTMGVALGLVLGKLVGVFGSALFLIRMGWAAMPAGAGTVHLLGVALLCGIGFTMSLFIGLLAFADDPLLQEEVKIGILAGSLAAGLLGWLVLRAARRGGRP